MTQYASKTPRDLSHDPEPWADESGMRWDSPGDGAWHMPRPEFDHVQHNEPNPILVAFREHNTEAARISSWEVPASPEDWIKYTEKAYIGPSEHTDHARRVLTRLANLSASKGN